MFLRYYRNNAINTVRPSKVFSDFVNDTAGISEFDLDENEDEESDSNKNESTTDEDMSDDEYVHTIMTI